MNLHSWLARLGRWFRGVLLRDGAGQAGGSAPASEDARHLFGAAGEKAAEVFLQKAGYRIRDRRFRTPVGELDLVCERGKQIVFVEVKARRDRRFADPTDAITPQKRRRLLRAAAWYVQRHRLDDRPLQFDVVTVVGDLTAMAEGRAAAAIKHIERAFDSSE